MVGPIFTDFDLADHIGQDRLNLESENKIFRYFPILY